MNITETLFETGNWDSKNITNKSDKVISKELLDQIETEGVTSEVLDTIKVPVFKYKTQITIHGLFPKLENNYLMGYKNLFQNKNLSIGVKYNAVDAKNKSEIYKILKHLGWTIQISSYDWFAYKKSEEFTTVKERDALLPVMKAHIAGVNPKLYFGSSSVFIIQTMFGFQLIAAINVNAIYQKNIEQFISELVGLPYEKVHQFVEEKIAKEAEERRVWQENYKREQKEFAEKETAILAEWEIKLTEAGYKKMKDYKITNNLQVIELWVRSDMKVRITRIVYGKKTVNYKKWSSKSTCIKEEEVGEVKLFEDIVDKARMTDKTTVSGWVKEVRVPKIEEKKPREEIVKHNRIKAVEAFKENEVKLIDYNDKCFAVVGDTKPIKDILKENKGFFVFKLKGQGPAWLFAKSKWDFATLKLKLGL